ncbi:MAG: GNAT family N-acetyltransferase [Bacteroidaceae bacterium]|nr:GNAT family N-acetyltransferase [Bacteroidaceae bacterium]
MCHQHRQIAKIASYQPPMLLHIKHYNDLTVDELHDILQLRAEIFVVEQNCPYQDIDGADRHAWHLWLADDNGMQAYVRVLPAGAKLKDASIGRVVSRIRHQGLASLLIAEGIKLAKQKLQPDCISLEAQVYARSLYEKAGFRQASEPFLEDGIPHILMTLHLCEQDK